MDPMTTEIKDRRGKAVNEVAAARLMPCMREKRTRSWIFGAERWGLNRNGKTLKVDDATPTIRFSATKFPMETDPPMRQSFASPKFRAAASKSLHPAFPFAPAGN